MPTRQPTSSATSGSAPEPTRGPDSEKAVHTHPDAIDLDSLEINTQTVILAVIAFLLILYTMYFAAQILMPVTVAAVLSLVFSPLMRGMSHLGIPRIVAAGLLVTTLVGVGGSGAYFLSFPAAKWLAEAPQIMTGLQEELRFLEGPINILEQASREVEEIGQSADEGDQIEVSVERESVLPMLLRGTSNFVFGITITVVLLFFLLITGDAGLRKIVRLTPEFSNKRIAVDTVNRMRDDITRYLFTITLINIALGSLVSLVLLLLGMPNPVLWGAMLGVMNFIPILGSLATIVAIALASLLTFEEVSRAIVPPLAVFAMTTLEGQVITPAVAGRRLALSPVAVFLTLVVMGWMWGIVGALIAVPLLAVIKLLCEHLLPLKSIATMLSQE